ncbi:hypothetical protein B9N43_08430 [Denitratisoma sp. DHT3]|uniref:hypothetical protein n=1 Tax=Denitratisoma sp. DHT3 TaxID=1981880 RepID=UPI0011985137|nr:hypothetical protein [Denitratisoma sp. DHT3]QDX81264.1 hypothetical protein B9N43_08430 [Denitratisoma sp. DHT3]
MSSRSLPRDREANRLPCVFPLALLGRVAVCELATTPPADAPLACPSPLARAACAGLHGLLRNQAAFALGLRPGRPCALPRATALKVQCGGLLGLQEMLDPEALAPDVHRLARLAQQHEGGLGALPTLSLIRKIAAWRDSRVE